MSESSVGTKDLLFLGLLVGGGYLLYKTISGVGTAAKAAGTALNNAGTATGGALFDFLNPNAAGSLLYYTITFPDGSRHSIDSTTVSATGGFTYNGINYQMMNDANGNHVAVMQSDSSASTSDIANFFGLVDSSGGW